LRRDSPHSPVEVLTRHLSEKNIPFGVESAKRLEETVRPYPIDRNIPSASFAVWRVDLSW
jgi:hypothetical protein